MSLLADLLHKIRTPHQSRSVPPRLEQAVRKDSPQPVSKKRSAMGMLSLASILGAGLLLLFYDSPLKTIKSPRSRHTASRSDLQGTANTTAKNVSSVQISGIAVSEDHSTNREPVMPSADKTPVAAYTEQSRETFSDQKLVPDPPETTACSSAAVDTETKLPQADISIVTQSADKQLSHRPKALSVDSLFETAERKIAQHDTSSAIRAYETAEALQPWNYRLYTKTAHLYIANSQYEQAAQHLKKALSLKSDYLPAVINMGIIYAGMHATEKAEEMFLAAMQIDPLNKDGLHNLWMLYNKTGRARKAQAIKTRLARLP